MVWQTVSHYLSVSPLLSIEAVSHHRFAFAQVFLCFLRLAHLPAHSMTSTISRTACRSQPSSSTMVRGHKFMLSAVTTRRLL
jgi:hypothetical protein